MYYYYTAVVIGAGGANTTFGCIGVGLRDVVVVVFAQKPVAIPTHIFIYTYKTCDGGCGDDSLLHGCTECSKNVLKKKIIFILQFEYL